MTEHAPILARGDSWRLRGPVRLEGSVRPAGDKSIAHRVVLAAALGRGTSRLWGLPDGEDVGRTLAAVAALGIAVERHRGGWRVHGRGPHGLRPANAVVECGNSGTTMRLLAGILASRPFVTILGGDASLLCRPMRRVAEPLGAMGARVVCGGPDGRPPLAVGGTTRPLAGLSHRLAVDSAQVRSALLFAGLAAAGPTRIEPAAASRDHTERLLAALGVHVRRDAAGVTLHPTRAAGWDGFDARLPGDLSSAAFWVALAAATPGARLRVEHVGLNPGRGRYLEVLRAAGAGVASVVQGEVLGEPWGTVRVAGSRLGSLRLRGTDVVQCIDEVPALVAAAAVAGAPAHIAGAGELRAKESDRISGLVEILAAFGAQVEERADGLVLAAGARLRPAKVRSHGDHRLAMAAAMLALAATGESRVEDVGCVRTSYPGFAADLVRLARPLPHA